MIPKKARTGTDTLRLLRYLYGPGRRDEHTDPHLVAAWGPDVQDPARSPTTSLADLALLLDAPVHALRGSKPRRHVYHITVRNDPTDRTLSDREWARVAAQMMHVAGIAPHGDDQGCRWVAIRHAEDHIHIVATLARQDGRQPNIHQDMARLQAAARRLEAQLGLRRLVSGDNTATIWPKTGEAEKAARRGLPHTARETLHQITRGAAAAAANEDDFFARITAAGARVHRRTAPDGQTTGYAVALPGDRDSDHTAVWYSGAKLAVDLSLPRARERWTTPPPPPPPPPAVPVAQLWRIAADKTRAASAELGAGGLHQGAADVAALGDLLVTAAANAPALARRQLRAAATEFERASRAPAARDLEGQARALYRSATRTLTAAAAAAGRNDTAALLALLTALVEAVTACRRWHQAHRHRAQAASAARAAHLLREAVEATTGAAARERSPRTRPAHRPPPHPTGRSAPAGGHRRPDGLMAPAVQAALPELAPRILTDPAWPALRARLATIEELGQDPASVLTAVATQRELDSAKSPAQVLTWRLDGWMKKDAHPRPPLRHDAPTSPPPGSAAPKTPRRGTAAAPQPRPPGDEQRKDTRQGR